MKKNIIPIIVFILLICLVIITFSKNAINCQDYVIVDYDNSYNKYEGDKKDLKGKTFTKTYNINHVALSTDDKYIYITIKEFQKDEIETVKVDKELFKQVEVGDNYEILFKIKDNRIKDNIKSIFYNSEIVKVEKTDRIGLEQLSEQIR